jgi:D-glycero-alpha-D-manno-heptose-7-phosphate kinase
VLVNWSSDGGSIYVYQNGRISARLFRLDLSTGTRQLVTTLAPADPAGMGIAPVRLTRDATAYAYSYNRSLSDLFLASGVKGRAVQRFNPDAGSALKYSVHVTASAPTRIDLAGGTIDIWPLYLFHPGASTINAAISLRAHVEIARRTDGRIELHSIDTGRSTSANTWSELHGDGDLPLLCHLARHYRLENATLTTRGESPAGAGIAGSSALTIAVAGALAKWTGAPGDADSLLQVAMNVECQTIRVPTGVQDYRPALYGGIAAIELAVDGIHRVGLSVDTAALERRIVLAYTGAPRNSGTNNWEIVKRHIDGDRHVFDCFERIRDTAAAMRTALERGDWDEVGRQIAVEWVNRKRLAPGVTTPTIEALIAAAQQAGATAAKVCGAGGGGCLFCYGPPERREAIAAALAAGGARLLDYRIETDGLCVG